MSDSPLSPPAPRTTPEPTLCLCGHAREQHLGDNHERGCHAPRPSHLGKCFCFSFRPAASLSGTPAPTESISGGARTLTFEQEIHALLWKGLVHARDLAAIFEREHPKLKGEERRLNEQVIAGVRADIGRFETVIPEADEWRERATSSPAPTDREQELFENTGYLREASEMARRLLDSYGHDQHVRGIIELGADEKRVSDSRARMLGYIANLEAERDDLLARVRSLEAERDKVQAFVHGVDSLGHIPDLTDAEFGRFVARLLASYRGDRDLKIVLNEARAAHPLEAPANGQ